MPRAQWVNRVTISAPPSAPDLVTPLQRIIYLIRHCAATGQEPEAPLTDGGQQAALALAEALSDSGIQRVFSSPYQRAVDTAQPLAERLGVGVVTDSRLVERVLAPTSISDWREKLVASFTDLDLRMDGGESSREAMRRGSAVLTEVRDHPTSVAAVVTHGNLLTLMLKSLDPAVGFAEWERMTNPDLYRVEYLEVGIKIQRRHPLCGGWSDF